MPSSSTPGILTGDTVTVEVGDITPFPGNPRIGNRDLLGQSLKQHGQYRALVVQSSTGYILAGNNTYHAAVDAGMTHVAVQYIDVGDEQAKRINLIDNRANDKAIYDDRLLLEMLSELETLEGTGYDPGDVDALAALLNQANDSTDSDQDILDESDRAAWPIIRAQVPPDMHQRWSTIDGNSDFDRVRVVMDMAGI